ncbi:polysaccharide biosynthesis/export family protein [Thiocapsa rosea]|uniref:Polysaccharide export outer membrane protein n=1 Tax=Thiocapsa rosea TaxID=69360 RepID=A0A495VF72_9GAMM|nr:polysaccharide biosynthesis/export family protein [Thiocapsa rosea]RKT47480.1 polysaccharide export outer membrane protein [Thiocapsa rosea]
MNRRPEEFRRFVGRLATAVVFVSMFAASAPGIAGSLIPHDGYRLAPGDVVAVSVWQEPGLEQLVLVRPDGGISFPLAGDLTAQGLTVQELADALKNRLLKFIPDPVVTVTLQEIPGNRIYVIGQVNKPGDFAIIARDVTVVQALAMAGGLTPFAKEKNIQILRKEGGSQRSIPFDYREIKRGGSLTQNVTLQAGDVILVP